MTDPVEIQRRRDFVAWHIKEYGWIGEFGQEGVSNDRWVGWNASLDSVCVELSSQSLLMRSEVIEAIERAGLKVKP